LKKTISTFIILILTIILYSCKSNLNFNFEIPDLDDYKIYEFEYYDFKNSEINDFEEIDDELLLNATKANISISNISYNNKWLFSTKDKYSGSGVIFYETEVFYYALTNAHVIAKHRDFNFQIIEVTDYFDNKYDGFIYEGSIDYEHDLAVIVFFKNNSVLPALKLVYGEIMVGDNIIAIGNPLGKKNVISVGKVIRYNKTKVEDRYGNIKMNEFYSIIHSSKTNAGSSGGMILNFDLDIVGINYGGNRNEEAPEGFAVSSEIVIDYITLLLIN